MPVRRVKTELEELLNSVAAWSWLAYFILFAIMTVESVGVPLPGLTVALAAAALAGQGRLEFWAVFLANVGGGVAGGMLGYAIGKYGGRRLLERYGRYFLLTPTRLAIGEAAFEKYGSKAVLVARYVPVLCVMSGVLSGIANLPFRRFAIFNWLGITLWSSTQLSLAYVFGNNLDTLLKILNQLGLTVGVIVALATVWLLWRYLRKRATTNRPDPNV